MGESGQSLENQNTHRNITSKDQVLEISVEYKDCIAIHT